MTNSPVCVGGTLGDCGKVPKGSLPVNGRQVTCSDQKPSNVPAGQFKSVWNYLKFGKFYCEMTDTGARLTIGYTANGE